MCAVTMVGGILLSDLCKNYKYWSLTSDINFESFFKSLATDSHNTSIPYLSIPHKERQYEIDSCEHPPGVQMTWDHSIPNWSYVALS